MENRIMKYMGRAIIGFNLVAAILFLMLVLIPRLVSQLLSFVM